MDKAISKSVNGVKDNIAFGLRAFTETVKKTHAEQYKAQVEAAQKAGEAIREHEDTTLGAYLAELEAAKVSPENIQFRKDLGDRKITFPTETREKELVAA